MIKNQITVDEAIEYLNSVLEADPLAMRALLCLFIPCNEKLANHPTAICNGHWAEGFTIGLLGLLNGMFGFDDAAQTGAIACELDTENRRLVKFVRADK